MITVLLSGGVDSAALLTLAKTKDDDVRAVFVDYGQRPWREEALASQRIADALAVELVSTQAFLDVQEMNVGVGVPGPRIVPNRNLVLLGIAANHHPDADEIWLGATAEDHEYRDCSEQFAINASVALGITVRVPLSRKTRADVLELADELGAPIRHAWSCYEPIRLPAEKSKPCGECNSCKQGQ